jgi:Fe-Mn family superoxide dismutase
MYSIPPLTYSYADLEPYIDEQTMRVHHLGHHQTYADKLNAALEKHSDLADRDLTDLIRRAETELPEDIRTAVVNNGGGFLNHAFFWKVLGVPTDPDNPPMGDLETAIKEQFGGYDGFKKQFADRALGLFGSGWTWLLSDGTVLSLENSANQNLPPAGKRPILALDLWEHAYYLKYQNRRAEYVAAFFQVIDWAAAEARYRSGEVEAENMA